MCGIAGVVKFSSQAVKKEMVQMMLQQIKHRGPDGEGVFIDGNVGLGHVRLSILDLSCAGHQPMTDETGRYTIVQNGEAYNYVELRDELKSLGYSFASQTDTEVVLKGYIAWGEKVLERINGMFAMAIYDRQEKTLFIARDRFGVKPLYYHVGDGQLIFASEIPAILKALPEKPKANENAIFDYLVFNRTDQTEETFFDGIYKLQHGCCMTLDLKENKNTENTVENNKNNNDYLTKKEESELACSSSNNLDPKYAHEQAPGQPSAQSYSVSLTDSSEKNSQKISKNSLPIRKWYNLAEHVQQVKAESGKRKGKEKEHFLELMKRAIEIRLRTDVPWGVCLSGGIDSSAITATVIREMKQLDVHSFSAVYSKDSKADESKFIDEFKGIVPNMHYVHPDADTLFAHLDDYIRIQAEPTPTTSPYAHYCVMNEAKKYVKVTLDGQGADEALAGYEYIPGLYYKTLFTHLRWGRLIREIVQYRRLHKSWRHVKYMAFFMLPSRMRTKVRVKQRGYIDEVFVARHKDSVIADTLYGSRTMEEMLINHFDYKLEHLLKWGDRNAMAHSMESRAPFLDKDWVEYSLALADGMKIHDGYTKYILRDVMKGIMPEKVRTRVDKMGFSVPQDEWFRSEKFRKLIMEILESESFAKRGYFKPEEAKKLYERHLRGEVNVSKDIWKWINLELWFRKYID